MACAAEEGGAVRLRVVSWNVRSLRDSAAGVAAALRARVPDVVLVQEAPRLLLWRTWNRQLAGRAGLRVVTGGRPAAGNLLLVSERVEVLEAHSLLLPRRPGLHRRGAVVARLAVGGSVVAVVGTHLDLDAAARLDSARRVRAAAPRDVPLVLGADVNEQPGEPAWQALAVDLVDTGAGLGSTFPAREPRRRIDALWVDPRLQVIAAERPATGRVSDHLPLLVDLWLEKVGTRRTAGRTARHLNKRDGR